MTGDFLDENRAQDLVANYMTNEGRVVSTQDVLDSGDVPRLKRYKVRPGKVSDSIFGGRGSYVDKKTGEIVDFENPPLDGRDGTPLRIMVRTERISTHDRLRGDIPFKDQVLALNHQYMRRLVELYLGTSEFDVPSNPKISAVILAENLRLIRFENVLRAFMAQTTTTTSLYQHFMKGDRVFCGHVLPDDLVPNGPLPYVMDTPSTKSEERDESVSPDELIVQGLVTKDQYTCIRNSSLCAFALASNHLRERGIILVDVKLEHGLNRAGKIVAGDEIITMDSSRFWLAKDYGEQLARFVAGEISSINPKSFSKQFARDIPISGDGTYTPEQRMQIAVRYILGIQELIGSPFIPDLRSRNERVVKGLEAAVSLVA